MTFGLVFIVIYPFQFPSFIPPLLRPNVFLPVLQLPLKHLFQWSPFPLYWKPLYDLLVTS